MVIIFVKKRGSLCMNNNCLKFFGQKGCGSSINLGCRRMICFCIANVYIDLWPNPKFTGSTTVRCADCYMWRQDSSPLLISSLFAGSEPNVASSSEPCGFLMNSASEADAAMNNGLHNYACNGNYHSVRCMCECLEYIY